MSNNQALTTTDRYRYVLDGLRKRAGDIQAMLVDIDFDYFLATVAQALRENPDILEATGTSIIKACTRAAYDGLRLDGREAALVTHNVKVSKNPDRWEKQAQYFPMVQGLIQQILRGGEVIALEADIIYQNDEHLVQRGTNAQIHHIPRLDGDRGNPIAAYSVATLKNGHRTFIIMTALEINEVRLASKSGSDKEGEPAGIWKRWWTQMWLKTVIRRHRKTLPLGERRIVDAEAEELFDFSRAALPAPSERGGIPARPTRASLSDQRGTEAGAPIDDAFGDGDETVVEQAREKPDAQKRQSGGKQRKTPEDKTGAHDSSQADSSLPHDTPANEEEWRAWAIALENEILASKTVDAVNALAEREKGRLANASASRRDWLQGHISDRLAELVSDPAGGSSADPGDNESAAQE